jgi:hypothetical protein
MAIKLYCRGVHTKIYDKIDTKYLFCAFVAKVNQDPPPSQQREILL